MSFSYYRLNILDSGAFTALSLFKFYDGSGTLIPTTGGTASASDSTFGAAANAFDGNSSTFWNAASPSTPAAPQWIQYQFGSAVDVGSFLLQPRAGNAYGPDTFQLLGSNDGSSWTDLGTYSITSLWSVTSPQTFTVNPSNGNGTRWRLLITASGGAGFVEIREWSLYAAAGASSPIPMTGGFSYASSEYDETHPSYAAIDSSTASSWAGRSNPTTLAPEYIAYAFSSTVSTVGSVSITIFGHTAGPTAFALEYSNDGGSTWITAASFTTTWPLDGGTQVFDLVPVVPALPQPHIFVVT